MGKQIDFQKYLEDYIENLGQDLKIRWNSWEKNLDEVEVYEVIGGLMARQVSIANEFSRSANLWNPNIAPILLRSMIDNYLNFCWILLQPLERSQKFIYFGLGQDKIQMSHRKLLQENNPSEENQLVIDSIESWINSQNYEFLTIVNVGSWSEKSVREMATETNELELYNYVYQPFSNVAHNSWSHIGKYNLGVSDNPLHRFAKVPAIYKYTYDFYYMDLAMKYVDMMFLKFDAFFKVKVDVMRAREIFYEEVDNIGRDK
ncbi:DUF5677 domain-containing protein [Frigoriflavimonas asaccharolytica]|uniref:Uncharacterized protein n=1 Tax=Frigoriflavimonas asaccharolytica TaxID=2735899 RepID=A0A8J8GAA2_9FLAO|nr:DUF5677 domain-containing protein [Frigoriflavimonas asaccharolytica]NRS94091.1 hypothetical protein [Frigoriflavimonas asaccharolytica]